MPYIAVVDDGGTVTDVTLVERKGACYIAPEQSHGLNRKLPDSPRGHWR